MDSFAGGGGASTGIEEALGRPVDLAVNHDPQAIALHQANHPRTKHFCEDVWRVDIAEATEGRPVGLAWFSPDCKHFSKAKGGKPRTKKIRGLAWVVVKWAEVKRPRVIMLENVEEFEDWGPLLQDGRPCPERKGKRFKGFVKRLEALGYAVEWRQLRACDYGAPTIRKRLYLIARCDGRGIVWPKATHGDPAEAGFEGSGLRPWRTAAECIDWSNLGYSIFLTAEEAKELRREFGIWVKRPLVEATMRRIAKGVVKFVIQAKEPFVVNLTHQGGARNESVREPFRTFTGAHRGEKALVTPLVLPQKRFENDPCDGVNEPLRTITAYGGRCFGLVSGFLAKHYGGVVGVDLREPIGTVTARDHHSLVAAHLSREFGESVGASARGPLPTVMPDGLGKTRLVASHLTKFYGTNTGQRMDEPLHSVTAQGRHLGQVCAFLQKYYGTGGQDQECGKPLHTIPTNDRFGLVTVNLADGSYAISDVVMRMLFARELYRGQGFPEDYIIEVEVEVKRNGRRKRVMLSQEAQVRMCGNSVCPPVAAALVRANVPELARKKGRR